MRPFGIVGRKDSGKTHLVERLVREFRARGLRVSTIKHTHHHAVEFDVPGKDSWRHRQAGAAEVILASDRGWSLVHAGPTERPPELPDLLARLAPCDLVLVEGYKGLAALPRLEVYRPAGPNAPPPLAASDPGIVALACPAAAPAVPPGTRRLELDDTPGIADFILAYPDPRSAGHAPT